MRSERTRWVSTLTAAAALLACLVWVPRAGEEEEVTVTVTNRGATPAVVPAGSNTVAWMDAVAEWAPEVEIPGGMQPQWTWSVVNKESNMESLDDNAPWEGDSCAASISDVGPREEPDSSQAKLTASAAAGYWRITCKARVYYTDGDQEWEAEGFTKVKFTSVGVEKIIQTSPTPEQGKEEGPAVVYVGTAVGMRARRTPAPVDGDFPTVWSWVSKPEGSGVPVPPAAAGNGTASITPDIAGVYELKAECGTTSDTFTIIGYTVTLKRPHGNPATQPVGSYADRDSDGANEGNEVTFNDAPTTQATAEVPCVAEIVPAAAVDEVKNKLRWTITAVGATAATWSDHVDGDTHTGKGATTTATYTGMPANNGDFGLKTVTLTISGVEGFSRTTNVEIFYLRDATNHPGGQAGSPNWYFYWSQTGANAGTHSWHPGGGTGFVAFVGGTWQAFIQKAAGHTLGGTWNNAEGIDLFANLCRHEERHRLDMIALWGAGNDRNPAIDVDGDFLPHSPPASSEATLVEGHPYDPADPDTYPDTFSYLPAPGDLLDVEDYCLRRQAAWTNGSANDVDWAHPGMQHQTIEDADD